MKKRIESCEGNPSANQYSNGCRCSGCREAWTAYSDEQRVKNRKKKKPSTGRRDAPIPEHDAFTREQIMEARK